MAGAAHISRTTACSYICLMARAPSRQLSVIETRTALLEEADRMVAELGVLAHSRIYFCSSVYVKNGSHGRWKSGGKRHCRCPLIKELWLLAAMLINGATSILAS